MAFAAFARLLDPGTEGFLGSIVKIRGVRVLASAFLSPGARALDVILHTDLFAVEFRARIPISVKDHIAFALFDPGLVDRRRVVDLVGVIV